MGATVGDVALIDAVVHHEPAVTPAHLVGAKVVIAEDWLAEGPPLAPEARQALELATAAFEKLGAQVVAEAGFNAVKNVAKATWEPPLPVPIETPKDDLQAYLDYHGDDLPSEINTVAKVSEKFGGGTPYGKFLQGFFLADPVAKHGEEGFAAKLAERDAAIASTEVAYAAFFRKSGASCVLLPTFPAAPCDLSDPKSGLNAMFNEGAYTAHLCAIKGAPAIVMPTPVKYESCGVPCSVMLYGKDDRQLLGVALALEAALKA